MIAVRHLSRETQERETRFHGLDTLRAAAILWVMPFHLQDHFPGLLQEPSRFGWMGVDLFFVLSGFLIATQMLRPSLQGNPLPIRDFHIRRAFRILPAYLAVLLLYIFWPAWRESPGLQPWWQFVTFTENFLIDYGRNQAFSHAWSLCVEEHFYLLLPWLTLLLLRRPAAWKVYLVLLAVLLAGIGTRAYVFFHILRPMSPDADEFHLAFIEKLYYPSTVRLDGLLAGVSLAMVRSFRPRWWQALRKRGHSLAIAGIATLAITGWCSLHRGSSVTGRTIFFDLFGYPLLGLGFALLTISALSEAGLLARFRVPGAQPLATLAFSLYLTHKAASHLLFHWFPKLPDNTWPTLVVLFLACFAVACVLYLGVERPFLLLRHRLQQRPVSPEKLDLEIRSDPAL